MGFWPRRNIRVRQFGKDEFRAANKGRSGKDPLDLGRKLRASAGLRKVEGRPKAVEDLNLQHGEFRTVEFTGAD